MAFLGRGVGRQPVGSHGLREPSSSEAQTGWVSQPSPWPRGSTGPCQKGGDQGQLLGCCLGQGHLCPISRCGDGQMCIMWLGAISLSAPGLKIKHFISGWLVPTMLSAIASLHSSVSQPFPCVTVLSATVTQIQAHI